MLNRYADSRIDNPENQRGQAPFVHPTLDYEKMEQDFHIAVIYQQPLIASDVVAGFEEDIHSAGLKILVEPIPMMGVRAAIEWLMPTAVIAYIAKPYFESFLGEMGKDHYAASKNALAKLRARIMARFGDRLSVLASKGKVSSDSSKFSPVFSLEAETSFGFRVKLLIQTELEAEKLDHALEAFFRFIIEINGVEVISEHSNSLLSNGPSGSVLLVCFNSTSGKLEYVSPIPTKLKGPDSI